MEKLTLKEKMKSKTSAIVAATASTMAACQCTMMVMAAENPFTSMESTISDVIGYAKDMLLTFIVPLAIVACLCSILIMYLPGMSTKTTDRCKSVIWSCIGTVVVAFALQGIFKIAENIGLSISA